MRDRLNLQGQTKAQRCFVYAPAGDSFPTAKRLRHDNQNHPFGGLEERTSAPLLPEARVFTRFEIERLPALMHKLIESGRLRREAALRSGALSGYSSKEGSED